MLKQNETYFGDCLVLMNDIKDCSIDMIFCDLPYGTTKAKWDSIINLPSLWNHYNRIIKPNGAIILFAQTPFDKVLGVSNLKMLRYEWIWEKTSATGHFNSKKMPMKAHENILVFYKKLPIYNPIMQEGFDPVNKYVKYLDTQNKTELYGKSTKQISGGGNTNRYPRSVIKFKSDKQKSKLHSTQKPIALCEYFIKTYTNEGMLVLDNAAGSGSIGRAAKNLNRNYINIENNEEKFKTCRDRCNLL